MRTPHKIIFLMLMLTAGISSSVFAATSGGPHNLSRREKHILGNLLPHLKNSPVVKYLLEDIVSWNGAVPSRTSVLADLQSKGTNVKDLFNFDMIVKKGFVNTHNALYGAALTGDKVQQKYQGLISSAIYDRRCTVGISSPASNSAPYLSIDLELPGAAKVHLIAYFNNTPLKVIRGRAQLHPLFTLAQAGVTTGSLNSFIYEKDGKTMALTILSARRLTSFRPRSGAFGAKAAAPSGVLRSGEVSPRMRAPAAGRIPDNLFTGMVKNKFHALKHHTGMSVTPSEKEHRQRWEDAGFVGSGDADGLAQTKIEQIARNMHAIIQTAPWLVTHYLSIENLGTRSTGPVAEQSSFVLPVYGNSNTAGSIDKLRGLPVLFLVITDDAKPKFITVLKPEFIRVDKQSTLSKKTIEAMMHIPIEDVVEYMRLNPRDTTPFASMYDVMSGRRVALPVREYEAGAGPSPLPSSEGKAAPASGPRRTSGKAGATAEPALPRGDEGEAGAGESWPRTDEAVPEPGTGGVRSKVSVAKKAVRSSGKSNVVVIKQAAQPSSADSRILAEKLTKAAAAHEVLAAAQDVASKELKEAIVAKARAHKEAEEARDAEVTLVAANEKARTALADVTEAVPQKEPKRRTRRGGGRRRRGKISDEENTAVPAAAPAAAAAPSRPRTPDGLPAAATPSPAGATPPRVPSSGAMSLASSTTPGPMSITPMTASASPGHSLVRPVVPASPPTIGRSVVPLSGESVDFFPSKSVKPVPAGVMYHAESDTVALTVYPPQTRGGRPVYIFTPMGGAPSVAVHKPVAHMNPTTRYQTLSSRGHPIFITMLPGGYPLFVRGFTPI